MVKTDLKPSYIVYPIFSGVIPWSIIFDLQAKCLIFANFIPYLSYLLSRQTTSYRPASGVSEAKVKSTDLFFIKYF